MRLPPWGTRRVVGCVALAVATWLAGAAGSAWAQPTSAAARAGASLIPSPAISTTPPALVAALEQLDLRPADVELVHFLTDHAVPHNAQGEATTNFRHRSFFVGADVRAAVKQGLADYVPMSIARVPALMAIGRIKVDVAFIQVSLPDEFGYVSLGVSVDVIPAAVAKARLVVAEVNPAMPRSMGDSTLHLSQIHALVPVDTPVIEYQHPPAAAQPQPCTDRRAARSGFRDRGSVLRPGASQSMSSA